MGSAEDIAHEVLAKHRQEIDEISRNLASLIIRLKQMDLQTWRADGRSLVCWMNSEADDMAKTEKDVAITKATGGSAAIAGGLMSGVGLVASFFTFGLTAPLAVAGLALGTVGAATSAGGEVAQLSIVHMKTCKIKERFEAFAQRTKEVVSGLLEMGELTSQLSELCAHPQDRDGNGAAVITEIVLKASHSAMNLLRAGVNLRQIGMIVYDITRLQNDGVIFGSEFLRVAAGRVAGSGLSVSKALFKGAGAALNIGFGIWEVVDASGVLQNGGSNAALIRKNANQLSHTLKNIDDALDKFDL